MTVLITSTGSVKTRLFRCDFTITPSLIDMFEKVINERFSGLPVTGVTPALMQGAAASLGEMSMLLSNVLLSVQQAAREAASTNVSIRGQSNLFLMPELQSADGKRVMELLGSSGELAKLLTSADTKASILIGSEMNNPALSSLSVIAASYIANTDCCGSLALIGPIRMNYPRLCAALEFTAQTVGELLSELLDVH